MKPLIHEETYQSAKTCPYLKAADDFFYTNKNQSYHRIWRQKEYWKAQGTTISKRIRT